MADDLEERLRGYAKSFDGLLSLIPAKYYYGQDNSNQWRKKKQTKQEAKQAKLAKLDPDSAKSAKDVRDENERKRKRDMDEASDIEGIERERPKEGLRALEKKPKKQRKDPKAKAEGSAAEKTAGDALAPLKAEGSAPPVQKLKADKRKKDKGSKKKAGNTADSYGSHLSRNTGALDRNDLVKADRKDTFPIVNGEDNATELIHMDGFDNHSNPSVTPTPAPESPNFDLPALPSGSSSISSIIPLTSLSKIRRPSADPIELKARLAARIEALRAARKADGPDGAPARNRQELMDARRRKEEQRREHKKELRLKAKEDEKAREMAAPSGTISQALPNAGQVSLKEAVPESNFSFGRVAFSDGQQLDSSLSSLSNPRRRKGPQDPLTAMKAAENKRARLSSLDEEKLKEIEEKDLWLNACKRAHGEKIKDDSVLLSKTLKRKEKVKKKSEKEWKERIDGVDKGKVMRQKKRDENLRKRREEKSSKGKGKVGKSGKKVQRRPGFEGSFAAKTGGKRR
ncbi:hypothetical protein FGG08_003208 [Glutinoglossum americanum]|uniref:Uncharacterized protein n=1 Tax=Glutinoglossum americanum TaxID=1670608 RepID=A0A9P8I301_9PEZI|nr:hypothetical protein FGG08_003208 [Glutinoglossum americanum]